eukprot:c1344_g1_i1.p1 GENE.c1344_g1_i1~~c1344_g1_i1.p1  ORF type:complete len:159 (+),score=65.13 c1344_g1_i1:39-479(+)
MADTLSKEQIAELQEGFELYDPERTGQLAIENLGKVARACGANPTEEDIQTFIDNYEEDYVDFTTFLEFMSSHTKRYTEAELKKKFQIFDREKTGKIVASEMRHVLCSIGDSLSVHQVDEMFQEVGVDKDGMISFDDFVRVMARGV